MLEVIVFVSGALVMVLEMTASRVLAPYLGTSLVVWTSLIGVVLAFLALGAWVGGRLADRSPSRKRLSLILALAGVCTGGTALAHPWVGRAVSHSLPGLHSGALVAATLLLALPAALFGMVSPYVIRLRLKDLGTSGSTVGRLYALSTAGSIAGTFLGGFVLIAWLGSSQILFGVAALMLALSVPALGRFSLCRAAAFVCLAAAAALSASHGVPALPDGRPALVETPYNALVIREFKGMDGRKMRVISTDPGKSQSAVYPDAPEELVFPYTRLFAWGTELVARPSRVLMLGGGGYSMARWLLGARGPLGPGARLDVVELDPGMTAAAEKYFGLPGDPRLRILHEDARRFLNRNSGVYDVIFVDVFGSEYSVPFHMGTIEAVHNLRRATAPDGVVLMNVISALEGDKGRLFQAIYQGLRAEFPRVEIFAVLPHERTAAQNIVLAAFPDTESRRAVPPRLALHSASFRDQGIPALTDEYAPVERYTLSLLVP